jgi:hypothetical protein
MDKTIFLESQSSKQIDVHKSNDIKPYRANEIEGYKGKSIEPSPVKSPRQLRVKNPDSNTSNMVNSVRIPKESQNKTGLKNDMSHSNDENMEMFFGIWHTKIPGAVWMVIIIYMFQLVPLEVT